ncbi:MAG: glutaredoxin [Candidatus Poseidonia sp.]|nr:glutaredoxin [Poseidonia sp.]MBL6748008.1 glutaredoxin [Poseidonia sp.]MBL6806892.1 glutaredoxin [Poseidonia sp.]MBL6885908.1 glutaredoxin [Poseidonia sp.]MBL6892820.1 glutaredoxin [Poseidonia sp.]
MDKTSNPEILIWTNRGCSACVQAKQFFERERLPYTERRLKADGKGHRAFAKATGGAKTVPQIFIGDQHVGGYDDLIQAAKTGDLDVMLGRTEAKSTKGFLARISSRFQRG